MLSGAKKWIILDALLVVYLMGLLFQHFELNFNAQLSAVLAVAVILVGTTSLVRNINYKSAKLGALALLCLIFVNQLSLLNVVYKTKAGNGFDSISSFVVLFIIIIGFIQIYPPKPTLKIVYYGILSFCSLFFAGFLVFLIIYCLGG